MHTLSWHSCLFFCDCNWNVYVTQLFLNIKMIIMRIFVLFCTFPYEKTEIFMRLEWRKTQKKMILGGALMWVHSTAFDLVEDPWCKKKSNIKQISNISWFNSMQGNKHELKTMWPWIVRWNRKKYVCEQTNIYFIIAQPWKENRITQAIIINSP